MVVLVTDDGDTEVARRGCSEAGLRVVVTAADLVVTVDMVVPPVKVVVVLVPGTMTYLPGGRPAGRRDMPELLPPMLTRRGPREGALTPGGPPRNLTLPIPGKAPILAKEEIGIDVRGGFLPPLAPPSGLGEEAVLLLLLPEVSLSSIVCSSSAGASLYTLSILTKAPGCSLSSSAAAAVAEFVCGSFLLPDALGISGFFSASALISSFSLLLVLPFLSDLALPTSFLTSTFMGGPGVVSAATSAAGCSTSATLLSSADGESMSPVVAGGAPLE
ncbi:unnamed protein product [Meganyctiphanes norvegica]|uniref:Uncharacterized protein n=1 Tax=Meganyctiphanes norvegica TaxID=48144 RepID=A0AAV2SE59_MEGNR